MADMNALLNKTKGKAKNVKPPSRKKPTVKTEDRPYDALNSISSDDESASNKKVLAHEKKNPTVRKNSTIANYKQQSDDIRDAEEKSSTCEPSKDQIDFDSVISTPDTTEGNVQVAGPKKAETNASLRVSAYNLSDQEIESKAKEEAALSILNTKKKTISTTGRGEVDTEETDPESIPVIFEPFLEDIVAQKRQVYDFLQKIMDSESKLACFNIIEAAKHIGIPHKSFKTCLSRLQKDSAIKLIKFKPGRNSRSVYYVHELKKMPVW